MLLVCIATYVVTVEELVFGIVGVEGSIMHLNAEGCWKVGVREQTVEEYGS